MQGIKTSAGTVHDVAPLDLAAGDLRLTIDPERGTLRSLVVGERVLIHENTQPLFRASLLATAGSPQGSDFLPDAIEHPGVFRVLGHGRAEGAAAGEAALWLAGEIVFPGREEHLTVETRFVLGASAEPVPAALHCEVSFEAHGAFEGAFLRELAWALPLQLQPRKRIAQGGDQGLRWDTRYFYQFHVSMDGSLLTEPEVNAFEIFSLEQETAESFQIWRSESAGTAALLMQRGSQAPGWSSVYDRAGGLLLALRGIAQRAPVALQVHAAGGGEVQVAFQPRTQPAADLRCALTRQRLFGQTHVIDLIPFAGGEDAQHAAQEAEERLEARWQQKLASRGPSRLARESPMHGVETLWLGSGATGSLSPVVTGGVPLPQGAVQTPQQVRLFEGEREWPLQTRAMAWWPDGSIKWLELVFPVAGASAMQSGAGEGERVVMQLSERGQAAGEARPITLVYGPQVRQATIAAEQGVQVTTSGADTPDTVVRVDTGPLQFEVRPGTHWLGPVRVGGQVVIPGPGAASGPAHAALGHVDYLWLDGTYPVRSRHPQGAADHGPVAIESVAVETQGPLKVVLRLEGWSTGRERTRVILRLTSYRDRPWIDLEHTVEFWHTLPPQRMGDGVRMPDESYRHLHADPREAMVRRLGLELPVTLASPQTRITLGGQHGPVAAAEDADRAGLEQHSHLHYQAWSQAAGAPVVSQDAGRWSRGWLDMRDGQRGVTVALANMWQKHPKRLLGDRAAGRLEIGFWPASAPLMDVRRYSDFPHRSQGESVPEDNRWVSDTYYARDPFAGTANTHHLRLHLHRGDDPAMIDAVVGDYQSRPLIYAGEAWYRQSGVTLPAFDPGQMPGIARNLENTLDFWLFNQRVYGWYGLWHYGDVQHRAHNGYGWVLPPDQLVAALQRPEKDRFRARDYRDRRVLDYVPQHNWAFDNGRWGWANTEGLFGLFLQNEYLRTGRREVFFAAEAMARQARDVVTRHGGQWFGTGTRHGVQPWSDGGHQSRQTILTEYRLHHYLAGEARSAEVMRRIVKETYLDRPINGPQDHGTVLYGLLWLWELSGDPAIGQLLHRYVGHLIVPEGLDINPQVRMPGAQRTGGPRMINGASMFFHTFGGTHALLEIYELTRREDLKQALVQMAEVFVADAAIRKAWHEGRPTAPPIGKVVAFAARYAADPEPFRAFLQKTADSDWGWRYMLQLTGGNPEHWSGETAFALQAGTLMKFWINALPYMAGALSQEPALSEARAAQFERFEQAGVASTPRETSWQEAYDGVAVLDAYLGPWQPWRRTQPWRNESAE